MPGSLRRLEIPPRVRQSSSCIVDPRIARETRLQCIDGRGGLVELAQDPLDERDVGKARCPGRIDFAGAPVVLERPDEVVELPVEDAGVVERAKIVRVFVENRSIRGERVFPLARNIGVVLGYGVPALEVREAVAILVGLRDSLDRSRSLLKVVAQNDAELPLRQSEGRVGGDRFFE